MEVQTVTEATPEEAQRLLRQFQKHFFRYFIPIPAPRTGGTFHYCRELVNKEVPKFDSLGRKTRYTKTEHVQCGSRFRNLKTYRRHWRRKHMLAA